VFLAPDEGLDEDGGRHFDRSSGTVLKMRLRNVQGGAEPFVDRMPMVLVMSVSTSGNFPP